MRPGREVWLVWGDGSSAYTLAEFDTYVRHGVAPIAVIGNDASWMQIAREQVEILGTTLGTDLRRTDYHKVAEGYGGVGLVLDRSGAGRRDARRGQGDRAGGPPVCVNVILATSDFRKRKHFRLTCSILSFVVTESDVAVDRRARDRRSVRSRISAVSSSVRARPAEARRPGRAGVVAGA